MIGPRKKLCLVDGNSYIHRAYHAVRNLSNSRGMPTNAVFGFTSMLMKVIKDVAHDLLVVAFDSRGPTFRHEIFPEYKANRPPMPDDLVVQVDYIKRLTSAFGLLIIEREGVEADDILATLGRKAERDGMEVLFITGDKDMQQIVDAHISILDTMKDRRITLESFRKDHGFDPAQLVDFMALTGDATDNIPGVPGIGPKTAQKLIKQYGSLEGVYRHLEDMPEGRTTEALRSYREQAVLSRTLSILKDDLDLSMDWESAGGGKPDIPALKSLFEELEFKRFLRELDLGDHDKGLEIEKITSEEGVSAWMKKLDRALPVALSIVPAGAGGAGSLCCALSQDGRHVVVLEIEEGWNTTRAVDGRALLKILEDGKILKWGFDFKDSRRLLKKRGITLRGLDIDILIASYLINPTDKGATLGDLAITYLGTSSLVPGEGVSRRQQALFAGEELARARTAYEAAAIQRLGAILEGEMKKSGVEDLYRRVELPLINILGDMEEVGIGVDRQAFMDMSREMEIILHGMEEEIYACAGERFNIGSPKQLAEILFEKLNLPVLRKTKTGYSTDEGVLTNLAAGHELPSLILGYRQLIKLKNTYVDVLPKMASSDDGRIHSTFNQAVTATGRLSSSNPNLQNIPIRSEWGRRIRNAFVPREGWRFISADYSQIELRVLAHLSGDETLIEAFRKGEDIHTRTASEIFKIPADSVNKEMRRVAKVINFGIIYGMSPFGLSKELGLDQREARKYIEDYFIVYKGVRRYLDGLIADARENGYVSTMFGRRRYLKELQSDKSHIVQFAERAALNTPIQGTAADLIKMAMINVASRLARECRSSKLLVQIHDELLLEAVPEEVEKTSRLVRECMESAASFSVPIVVEIAVGEHWGELK